MNLRPLDPLSSIKVKLSVVIVAAVAVTVTVIALGASMGSPPLASAVIAAVLALGLVQILARGMTSPLREMATVAGAMARGDYEQRVTASSRDEVGALAVAFNAMAAELAGIDRIRRDLVANVSHELRTPITALQAGLENLVDGVQVPDTEALAVLLVQAERLGALVSQFLELSRLESGTVPLERERFAIGTLLEDAARDVRLHSDRAEVVVNVDPVGLEIHGDALRIHQVVANLLDNAVRHSPAGGRVEVTARTSASGTTLEVCDEGPGIDPDDMARVFERFYRADTARSAVGGAGLGLSIARWIVDLHGGRIRAESRHPQGCRMVVWLPAGAGPATTPGAT
ncbi:MAG: sensor histidine kinase [Acidimicrobiales bacterium]